MRGVGVSCGGDNTIIVIGALAPSCDWDAAQSMM